MKYRNVTVRSPSVRVRFSLVLGLLVAAVRSAQAGESSLLEVEVREHLGRPTLTTNGVPVSLAAYSPSGHWNRARFVRQVSHFLKQPANAYFISAGRAVPKPGEPDDFYATPLWHGDSVSNTPMTEFMCSPDIQSAAILADQPEALLFVRFGLHEPASWRRLHAQDLVVTEAGETLQVPSLASEAYWEASARYAAAVIEYAESRPWAHRLAGYANFMRMEGTHEPMISYALFDHGPAMTARWRSYLRENYGTVDRLRAAYRDESITFETMSVPCDRLRGKAADISALNYWQAADSNPQLRDYLLLQRNLYHAGFRRIAAASQAALQRLGRKRVLVYDSHKSTMQGWDNIGFFGAKNAWQHAYPELLSGSGNMDVAQLFDLPGMDGLINPHDYQARGPGGVFEPEGVADSAVLRGKLMLCEMDTRTWAGTDPIAPARDAQEFAATTWRNLATALTRGFTPYWMDVHQDWFAPAELQPVIRRQIEVLKEAVRWPHETVPGIAMIIDDAATLETNGDGRYLNEAVLWEWKAGLARSGVPVRIYLVDDLALPNFPKHRVFYFPNLFRVNEARLALLRNKVLRNGHLVVWGPGSGISDGQHVGTNAATRLTGFAFDLIDVNYPRRTLLSTVEHPLTQGLSPATILGGPLAYGPVLFPKDGLSMGVAWTQLGRNQSGLAVKTCTAHDGTTWTSVFSTTVGLPAGFWRNCARMTGTHVWCESDEIILADRSVVAIHSLTGGKRTLRFPEASDVIDLLSNTPIATGVREITCDLTSPGTRVFRRVQCK